MARDRKYRVTGLSSTESLAGAPKAASLSMLLIALVAVSAVAQAGDEEAVEAAVERFLAALGDGDLDAVPDMFVSSANIGTASLRDGQWVSSTLTFADWIEKMRQRGTWRRFREPVSEFTIHVEDGRMAFVRADATVVVEDRAVSHNIDYFTLVREDGAWKFLSASYVARPIDTD